MLCDIKMSLFVGAGVCGGGVAACTREVGAWDLQLGPSLTVG